MSSLFDSYNARFIDLRTVAQTFVLRNSEFAKLREHNHSLLIGPRGSGKTTLLKMLKIGAQVAWNDISGDGDSSSISFAAIYVGADRQLDFLISDDIEVNPEISYIKSLISKSLLSVRVKFSCLDTLAEIADDVLLGSRLEALYCKLTREQLSEICRLLSVAWNSECSLTPLELRLSLRRQIASLNAILDQLQLPDAGGLSAKELIQQNLFLSDDPIQTCSAFIDVINGSLNEHDRRWALCIDELEILPNTLQQSLFNSYRSQDQRMLLKLATSPFSGLNWDRSLSNRPMEGHDFTPVNLAYANKQEARRFSVKILDGMIDADVNLNTKASATRKAVRAVDVLGRSPITEANTDAGQKTAYRPGGDHHGRFTNLAERDIAFRQYLSDRGIDLDSAFRQGETARASLLRKHIWQVAVRLEYGPLNQFRRRDSTTSRRAPSRKSLPSIYLGYDSLMTICEGNPRTTIGLFRPMLRRAGAMGRVESSVQSELLREAIAKYVSLLSAIRLDALDRTKNNLSIVDLLDSIGQFFSQEVNGETFHPEPSLTIKIDSNVPPEYHNAIGVALNQGALVMLNDESGSWGFGGLVGSRLRLSYLLCPRYHLPLVSGQQVNLSRALDSSKVQERRTLSFGDLFDGGWEDA